MERDQILLHPLAKPNKEDDEENSDSPHETE